jgi:hypothetical protein
MALAHSPEFRRGPQLLLAVTTVAGLLGTLVPGEPSWQRVVALPYAFFLVCGGFAAGWLLAHVFRLLFGWISQGLARGLSLLYFYGAPLGAILMLLLSAWDPAGIDGQEVTLREMILFVPASLGISAGIRHVLN